MEKTLEQQPSNCIKIVLFGPESSGKTTLAQQLAAHYNTRWVPEFMREYLQEKWDSEKKICEVEDLLPIARGQMQLENNAASKVDTLLFCDTNLLELKVYSEYYYHGFCPSEIKNFAIKNRYDLYLLTYIDTPWEQDDLRDRPHDRQKLFRIFETELQQLQLPFQLVKGSKAERLETAIQAIEKLRK